MFSLVFVAVVVDLDSLFNRKCELETKIWYLNEKKK